MQKLIIIITLLIGGLIFGQQKNVYVEYAVKISDEKDLFSNNLDIRRVLLQAISNADKLSFALLINKSGSKFYDRQALTVEEGGRGPSLIFSSYSGIVYQFENAIFKETRSLGKEIMVKGNLKDDWVLQNETKMIDNYLCYKATSSNNIDNGQGKIFRHPIVAWYCPKLPYHYGPNGYSNLPGLILELQVRNVLFGVKKIDLNSSLDFDVAFLKNVKMVSLEELNKKLDEQAESWKQ